jgi:hypothetical protein
VSSLVQKPFTAPPYLAGDPDRAAKIAAIVAEVQQVLAPYDVAVVTTRPAPGVAYDLLVAGGKEADAGLPVVDALTSTRNCDATGAHVMLLFDDLSAQHDAARAIVGMLGVAHGISQSKVHDDCMCYTGCGFGLTSACTIGGAGTPVNAMYACTVDTTMDEQAAWRQTFGARP